jgi:hypothetical protein
MKCRATGPMATFDDSPDINKAVLMGDQRDVSAAALAALGFRNRSVVGPSRAPLFAALALGRSPAD